MRPHQEFRDFRNVSLVFDGFRCLKPDKLLRFKQ